MDVVGLDLKNDELKNGEHNSNPVRFDDEVFQWGFWDETWSKWHGGFASEADARDACQRYCLTVLGWDTDA